MQEREKSKLHRKVRIEVGGITVQGREKSKLHRKVRIEVEKLTVQE